MQEAYSSICAHNKIKKATHLPGKMGSLKDLSDFPPLARCTHAHHALTLTHTHHTHAHTHQYRDLYQNDPTRRMQTRSMPMPMMQPQMMQVRERNVPCAPAHIRTTSFLYTAASTPQQLSLLCKDLRRLAKRNRT